MDDQSNAPTKCCSNKFAVTRGIHYIRDFSFTKGGKRRAFFFSISVNFGKGNQGRVCEMYLILISSSCKDAII